MKLMLSLIALCAIPQVLYGQNSKSITIDDHRPLAGVLDIAEKELGATINYEDVPYANPADLQDVSTLQQRTQSPAYHLWVPRKGSVTGSITVGSSTDQLLSVKNLIASFRNSALPGDFRADLANGAIYVTPTSVLGADGSFHKVSSPTEVSISVATQKYRAADAMAAVLTALGKASGVNIVLGSFPFIPVTPVNFGAEGESGRQVLARLFAQLSPSPASYRLLYDPMTHQYMMNVQVRPLPTSAAAASTPPTTNVQPAVSPFFKKEN